MSKRTAWLDSPFLARVGNFQTAARLAKATALILVGLVVLVVLAISQVPTAIAVLIGVGSFLLLSEALFVVFRRIHRAVVTSGPNERLAQEATELARGISALLGEHKRDEPDMWDPSEDPSDDSHAGWARRRNLAQRAENKALAKYFEQFEADVYAVGTEMVKRGAMTDDELKSLAAAAMTISFLDRAPRMLLVAARKLRDA